MGKSGPKPTVKVSICEYYEGAFEHPPYQEQRFCSPACAQDWVRSPEGQAEVLEKRYDLKPRASHW